ncbi:MARTX multifunctional-autoprocessing repeats-in-toxin holotoxin RtxA [Xenorhabdus anantnagensis]|uniref:MARTX multifunctional-autoprocessing repeats-in-toxin holotoxin RtxA n=1 Tax=Xenorhabdus anantnagensis TaxID=3025875 RepID=A0ABT5LPQ0_9GAMM|nr:MARTX multifunctional-autoprocessing repeats-in-toxin holotoxin RtxA [Xenorhabdus anantnagensis]MDC9596382.1 MARTX multifunctional-autoprocessing repeats-in-toxin holotoxin RtxA [Xenorhabdus anantnagensis]
MGKSSTRSTEYFFTNRYEDDDEGNTIHAIGVGGVINAYGGNDYIVVGSISATVNTTWGHDTIVGATGYLNVNDTGGDLTVKGGSGFTSINKTQSGPIRFEGVAGGVKINHTGEKSGIFYSGAAGYNSITRKGLQGDISFDGVGAYNEIWHETNRGNLSFHGAGAGNVIDRTWFDKYQGSQGDVTFKGAGAANVISSRVETGNIDFTGGGAYNHLSRKGKVGNITLKGAGAYNRIERIRQADDVYSETQGDIRFEGGGGYNSLYSDVAHGNISFTGAGGYNEITRKGTANDFGSEGMEYARAEEVVLTNATMSGTWIGDSHQVTGFKSAREPNTYLFAFEDGTHTKINKVQLSNDPATGKLRYFSTAWYKEGKYLKGLENQDISAQGGFNSVGTDGAYTLSNLCVEQRKQVTVYAVEKKLTENKWVNYGNGVQIGAADITLSDAKMGGYAIYRDGTTVDVKPVKSNRMPNTYVYGKQLGEHTKIVVVELRNDPKTGMLQYIARPWYKAGNHTANLANENISYANGYHDMGTGSYSLSDIHYSINAVRTTAGRVPDMHEYSELDLFKSATVSGDSSGDIHYAGAGGGNIIKSNVTRGNVSFKGAGIANVIEHSSEFGNTEFDGAGGANVIIKKGKEGNLKFNGAGIANVLLHQGLRGDMEVNAGGAANVLVRVGDGRYLAHLLAVGNISIHKGNGDSRIAMGGGFNTHTQIGNGDAFWSGVGGANILTQVGNGDVSSILVGGANVLTKIGVGDLKSAMFGGANIISHISDDTDSSNADSSNTRSSNTTAIALGGTNVLTKKGKGDLLSVMGGGANVLTHVGDGKTTGVMLGGANILTKVGNGDTTGIMLGLGNVLTHVGNGQTLGVMAAAGNIFTKVGNGTTIAAMVGVGNIFTHVGEGNAWALMGGAGNVFTKVGKGDALALMLALGNVYTHIGDGTSVALMIAKGNIATKVGNGDALSAMIGKGNIFTQIGDGSTFAAMIGGASVLTKVGTGLTAALMVSKANIYTHVVRKGEESTSIGLLAGTANVMTKVGNGTTLAAMFGEANIMTHVGDGLTGVLALGKANIVTKVGNDFMGVVAASEANVVTHVGNGTTAALLAGKGNILTKAGDGTTVGLLISKIGNIMTHVGDGTTVGFAKGEANIITKVGDGLGINVAWGKANIMTHVGDGERYNFAKGDANIITKVGDGQEVTVVQGQANIVTHVYDGDDYTGAWGKANIITKVGDGRNVVLAKGEANIVTQIGDGDSFNALWSQGNIVTKVGDGMQVTAAKGKGNITTTVGDGLSVTAAHGDLNINTKVGDGVSVNVAWGKFNVNTRVGDGLNVSVMKGKGNANIRVGDGLNINASYARNNVAIQVGNGDFYSLAVAESNTQSNKLNALFDNIKQTVLGSAGSQGINYLVNGDEANTSGTHKGRGAIDLPEVSSLNGFKLTEMDKVTSDLKDSLKGSVTGVDTPDIGSIENTLGNEKRLNPNQSRNLIVNGDFEQGDKGWIHTNGIEASYSAKSYGLSAEGHGDRVSELDVNGNTLICQNIQNLIAGEEITVKFDFARRAGSSADNGLEVWWNGEVVYAAANGKSEWQNKTLTLTAKAGGNLLGFSGIGLNDGLGYVLDNVSATSSSYMPDSAITEHMQKDKAAQNALQDKEKAEADRQRLEQERDKQLAAVSGTQKQLETTDLNALNANGEKQRDAIKDEAQEVTDDLMAKAKGLEALDSHAAYHGESGQQWRDQFADGLLEHVQTDLDKASQTAHNQLNNSQKMAAGRLGDIKDAVAKSEVGRLKAEQNQQHAEQDVEDARTQAKNREAEAISYKQRAEQAERDGKSASQKAEQHGQHEVSAADSKTAQVQNNAKDSKLDDNYKPTRTGVTGSGLSGNVYESNDAENIEQAEKSKSHINPESTVQADGEFSQELQYLDEDLNELDNAKEALNRLQINAGIRTRNKNVSGSSTPISVHTETPVNQPVNQPANVVTEWVRNTPKISGLDLSGLEALGEEHLQQASVNTSETESSVAIRAQKVADIYRWLDSDNDLATEKYIPVPRFERVDADIPEDLRQKMVTFVEGYLDDPKNSVPKEQRASLAKLFVDATIDYDWDKRVEFVTKLESYGYSFEPVHGDKSIVSFWSGKNFKQYRTVLDAVQPDGKKIVYDTDVKGNLFAIDLNKTLMRWGNIYLDSDVAEQKALHSAIYTSAHSNTGFWSSLYATGSRDDVYVIAEGGLRLGNFFWNVELPVLRQLQREGLVGEIRLLDKAAKDYQGVSPESIGRRLTEAGVSVKARFDSLGLAEQERLLALNPDKYRPDTLVDLDIKTSAIDNLLNQALPFYGLRTERNLLVRKSDDGSFAVRPWPGNNSDVSKTIIVEDPDDSAQIKSVERFILANYENYDQLPESLYLSAERIITLDHGRTRIIAEKVEGSWKYKPEINLMSVSELQEAAYVKGKIRGDSYRNVLEALKSYENTLQNSENYDLEAVEKLTHLRQQVEGYLLGHPDSERVPALKNLLSQVNVRMEESLVLTELTVNTGKDSFSELYNKLSNANLKDSKHLYIDEQGDFVTRGKSNIQIVAKAESAKKAVEQVKAAITKEYGQSVADTVFATLPASELSKDGKGIDVSGLRKIHQAIEQHLSPVSATLFVWKPSDHSRLGHAALQIGQGRTQINAENAEEFNEKNYVSWWPKGGKSSDLGHIFDVDSEGDPDLRRRWRDFSQPASQNKTLEHDVASEEHDNFGLTDGTRKLEKFIEKLQIAKGIDAKFKDISESFAIFALERPELLQSAGVPEAISRPFVKQVEEGGVDLFEVGKDFAKALRRAASQSPELTEKRITNVIRQFAERELSDIQDFKASEGDQGRVFRINLAGLDAAAMQAEWQKINQNPDARYQLLTDNCSSIVARVLKAGGADKVIGHTWRPKLGVWTPTELFNFAQALQEAQVETNLHKPKRVVGEDLGHSDKKDEVLEKIAIDNDGTPPRDREPFNPVTRFLNDELYGARENRRNVDDGTQIILDDAVTKGTADKITLQGKVGRLTGYYHNGDQKDHNSAENSPAKKVVLFIHNSGSSAEEQASTIQSHYQKQGIDMLAVNMRGYGASDGHPNEKGLYQDARTMFNYLVNDRGIKPENIIIHGYSMGGAVAADLARYAERNGQAVSGLLLDRPMPSMTKAITAHEVPNPAGITGVLAKTVNGQFSVEKNLQGISKQTPIMLLTDNEGLGKEGEKLRAKLVVAGYQVSGEQTFYGHEASGRLMNQYADQIVSALSEPRRENGGVKAGLLENTFKDINKVVAGSENGKFILKASAEDNSAVSALDNSSVAFDVKTQPNELEILKGIESDLKRYGKMLEPQADRPGKKPTDIRTTEDFLTGYKQGYAEQVVDGFRPGMDIKQLVDLLAKGSWSAEQKGALAWEIESRALKITFQPRAEKFNRLFRDVASTGISDTKANEQLAPQLLLLNLSNDGFGGRCDPLSKLVLVAKQLENDGQDGVARQLLEKMYSAAAVLNNPDLYSETEHANANKLLGSLSALHAKNPMADTFIKVWKEKLEDAKALTVDGVIQKVTAGNTEGKPVLLELDGPNHAMAAWAKGNGENRVYGFYDPNAGIVEFSSAEKFGAYVTRFFGESDLNMAQSYKLPKNAAGESVFERVVVIDGDVLATYRPRWADKTTMRDMLDLPVFDDTDVVKKPLGEPSGDNLPESHIRVNNQDVDSWVNVDVKPQPENSASRFSGQIIIQTENDPVAAKAAASLASKHPDSSVIVQLDANGQYRVVYGDPAVLSDKLQSDQSQSGKLRWQIVGHGREESTQNHTRMSGYSADELALRLQQFRIDFKQAGTPDHISLVGCSLISEDNRKGFAHSFISALDKQGIRTTVSARSSEVAVDNFGRKYTKDAQEQWVHKLTDNKIVLEWNDKGEVESHTDRIRRGISEQDINLSHVGQTDVDAKAQGAIADNTETFHAPKVDHEKPDHAKDDNKSVVPAASSNKQLSYSGNIQLQLGNGEFTAINWGTTNVGIKVGTGGFKSLAFGDNNVMVHIGDGDSKHSVDIAGYQALEGAQLFVGNRNISFNAGRSNDLLVMLDKSIPTPPLVNPFGGAARISGVLQNISGSFNSQDWLTKQDQQWTLESAKKYVSDLSGLDLTSSVDYKTLTDLDSQNERSSRGLKSDLESTLNKQYNQWLGGNGNTPEMGKVSRADKFRQANEKLAFNFAVGGQGADIQVTTGNWNFMFGDNIQSILDTNLGSLFGLMTQGYTPTGMAKNTFTFSPTDLPRQIKNKLLGNLAGIGADTTLADIFGVDYTPNGGIVSRSGQSVDGVAILRDMLEIIGEFSGDQLKAFTDPNKLLDGLKASLSMGKEGVKSFVESHGLKVKAPDEKQEEHVTITKEGEPAQEGKPAPETVDSQADRDFGLTSLNLPNLFATLFNQDKQAEMKSLVTNLKKNLTADLLNMQDKTFDFLRNSGHLQGDGDINISLGNYNFNWGGDGKDLGAYLGDNNNFWGGRGDDVFYSVGTSNIFTGGEGSDTGVMMGRENMMFGGAGNDVGVLAGRINYAYMGDGDDQVFAFGEGGVIDGGKGRDYIVASGNFNHIDAGEDQDYVVTIGNNNQVDLGEGNDFATVFGNYNRIDGNAGKNSIKLMGYHAVINGGTGDDHLIADVVSKFSQINGGDGDDLLVLGGYQNRFKGGTGVNSFVVSGDAIDNVVEDIKQGDKIIFNDISWKNLWLQRSGYDLVLLTHRNIKDTSAQGQFEALGSVTFNNYFNGNRADIITQRGDKDTQGEREYTALSANAVDSLVQAMSGFAPNMGDSGFIDSLNSQTKSAIVTAWSDTTNGKSKLV